ncbi:hypothetical protein A2U01_0012116 [Trifolium medium]|uniref:Uncharacterized protein n=1 Tax=Trifolium medium TaxID=97028 RepID=A0A392MUH1_9FABA|nr:hypothetical protein [Trifolium medium]
MVKGDITQREEVRGKVCMYKEVQIVDRTRVKHVLERRGLNLGTGKQQSATAANRSVIGRRTVQT